jgi:hypothetical protein
MDAITDIVAFGKDPVSGSIAGWRPGLEGFVVTGILDVRGFPSVAVVVGTKFAADGVCCTEKLNSFGTDVVLMLGESDIELDGEAMLGFEAVVPGLELGKLFMDGDEEATLKGFETIVDVKMPLPIVSSAVSKGERRGASGDVV